MNNVKITKIKIIGAETEIHCVQSVGNLSAREEVFKSWELQSPDFKECLEPLKRYLLGLLQLPPTYSKDMTIIGLTIKYEHPDDFNSATVGIVITALKKLPDSNAPFCITTPYIPPQRNEKVLTAMGDDLICDLEDICDMAKRFMQGKERAQGELFEGKK